MSIGKQEDWFYEHYAGAAIGLSVDKLLHEENSAYQKIAIFKTKYGNLMTLDGKIMLTTQDNFIYHEMVSHPALYSHPEARRVVIIGGGDCGTLREVLRHSVVESVVQVELDERVTRVSEKFFPELCSENRNTKAQLLFEDGVAWIEQATPSSVDVIILDTTDPVGQAARLAHQDFYIACQKALANDGILVAQSQSPFAELAMVASIRREFAAAQFEQIVTLPFPQPTYPAGWWSVTLGMKRGRWPGIRYALEHNKHNFFNPMTHDPIHADDMLPLFMKKAFYNNL